MILRAAALVLITLMILFALTRAGDPPHPLLVEAQAKPQPAFRLYAPCPLAPRNFPQANERTA